MNNIKTFESNNILINFLNKKNYKADIVNENALICNFNEHNKFYYEKLRKNGVVTEFLSNNKLKIQLNNKDNIDYIISLFQEKDLLIFDLDGVVFDVSESYMITIQETYKFFCGEEVSLDEILKVKSQSGMNCDWNVVEYLLKKRNINISLERIAEVFQNLFYNPEFPKTDYFINKEKLLISEETFKELSRRYDLVVFTGRLMYETEYSLKRFNIEKYFYYFVTADNKPPELLKPSSDGVYEILRHCPYKTIKYIGDSIDDIKAGVNANVDMIGVVPKNSDFENKCIKFKNNGAKYIIDDIKKLNNFLQEIEI